MQKVLVSKFVVPGEVVPQARPRAKVVAGHARVHDVPKCAEFRNLVRMLAGESWTQDMDADSCFEIDAAFFLPIPKSESQKRQKKMSLWQILPTRKPDLDNALKGVMDGITGIVWKDDAQVVRCELSKFYGFKPRTAISIFRIIPDTDD